MKITNHWIFLQAAQNEHDNIAHADIYLLSKKERLSHYSLHFFKYASNLMDLENQSLNEEKVFHTFKKQIRDTFLLNLAIENTFDISLSNQLELNDDVDLREKLQKIFVDISKENKEESNKKDLSKVGDIYRVVLKEGSRIAKMVEAIDHFEPINFEKEILKHNKQMVISLMPAMAILQEQYGLNWIKEILLTHAEIKMKKPWVKEMYIQGMRGTMVGKSLMPDIDLNGDFESNKKIISQFIKEHISFKPYQPTVKQVSEYNSVEKIVDHKVKNKELSYLQSLKVEQEKYTEVPIHVRRNVVIEHISNELFYLTDNIMQAHNLENPENKSEKKSNRNRELTNVIKKVFGNMFSICAKLNMHIESLMPDSNNISLSNILENTYLNNKAKTQDIDSYLKEYLLLGGELADVCINLHKLYSTKNNTSDVVEIMKKTLDAIMPVAYLLEKEMKIVFFDEMKEDFSKEFKLALASRKCG